MKKLLLVLLCIGCLCGCGEKEENGMGNIGVELAVVSFKHGYLIGKRLTELGTNNEISDYDIGNKYRDCLTGKISEDEWTKFLQGGENQMAKSKKAVGKKPAVKEPKK